MTTKHTEILLKCGILRCNKRTQAIIFIELFYPGNSQRAKRVVLFAPKAAREDVWERDIARHLPDLNSGFVSFMLRTYALTDEKICDSH